MFRFSGIVLAGIVATAAIAGENAVTTAPAAVPAVATVAMVGQPAPAFTLTDASGKKVSLADYKGKYVVLEWVNFDCPFVKKHYGAKAMQATQAQWTKQGVTWLSICSSAPEKQGYFAGSALTDRIKTEAINSTSYLIDADGSVGMAYGAKTTPHMFVIAPDGNLIYTGAIDDKASADPADIASATNYVSEALKASLAGKEVAVKATQSYGCSVKYAAKK
jgi:peroxiredoxin